MEMNMKHFIQRPIGAVAATIVLAFALQGCNATAAPPAASASGYANPHDEAARLIKTLDLTNHLQDSARDYASVQIARGVTPKAALERWIAEQRDRGAVIRCKPEVKPMDECIART